MQSGSTFRAMRRMRSRVRWIGLSKSCVVKQTGSFRNPRGVGLNGLSGDFWSLPKAERHRLKLLGISTGGGSHLPQPRFVVGREVDLDQPTVQHLAKSRKFPRNDEIKDAESTRND